MPRRKPAKQLTTPGSRASSARHGEGGYERQGCEISDHVRLEGKGLDNLYDWSKLTEQQKRFCVHYHKTQLVRQSTIAAGYSEKNASQHGRKMLKDPRIQSYIRWLNDKRTKNSGIKPDMVLRELANIATAKMTDYVYQDEDKNLTLVDLSTLSPEQASAIQTIHEQINKDGTRVVRVSLFDKIKATELLGKHMNLFNDKLDVNVNMELKAMTDMELEARIISMATGIGVIPEVIKEVMNLGQAGLGKILDGRPPLKVLPEGEFGGDIRDVEGGRPEEETPED